MTKPHTNIRRRVAVVIASKDGEATIADTVRSAAGQASVFIVSDGSSDRTALIAEQAGALVLALTENVGKPAAIYRVIREFALTARFEAIAILDDDTVVAPDFIEQAMKRMKDGVAIVVGKTMTNWTHETRWNLWVASRAYSSPRCSSSSTGCIARSSSTRS